MKDWKNVEADKTKIMEKHFSPGRAGHRINKLVIHHNSGTLTTEQCWSVWQTREASAHYQVEVDGTIGQLVWDRDTAWHAANLTVNRESIGIEHANATSQTSPISEATLDNGAHLVAALCLYYGLGRPEWHRNGFGHRDFHNTDCPGHLAGDQNAAYMARAQHYYDVMTGVETPAQPVIAHIGMQLGNGRTASFKAALGGDVELWKAIQTALHAQKKPSGQPFYNGPIDGDAHSSATQTALDDYRIQVYKTTDADVVRGEIGRTTFARLLGWAGFKVVD